MLRFVFQTCRENWFQSRRMQLSVTRWLIQSFAMVSSWKRKLLRMMVWIYIPVELQNKSTVRVIWDQPEAFQIRAVDAVVDQSLLNNLLWLVLWLSWPWGWSRPHQSLHWPNISATKRTTLVKKDDDSWDLILMDQLMRSSGIWQATVRVSPLQMKMSLLIPCVSISEDVAFARRRCWTSWSCCWPSWTTSRPNCYSPSSRR